MTGEPRATLVLAASATPALVATAVARLGWREDLDLPDPRATPGDDRVLGAWSTADADRLTLIDDGVHRILEAIGHDAPTRISALRRALPCVPLEAIADDLAATDPDLVARAARAAAWLGDPALAPALSLLRHHPDEVVRAEAAAALQATVPALVADGVALLRERGAGSGANPVWPSALPAQDRRQILRWLLRDHRELPRGGILATLRAALADDDWECRIGAAIGAARLGFDALGGLLERLELPRVTRGGPLPDDRSLLRAVHQGCLMELVRHPDPPGDDARSADLRHLRACIAGRPTPRRDHCWLLVRSLTEPADDRGDAPLPPGARAVDGAILLDRIPLAWVAPGEAWLGDERLDPPNPIRRSDAGPAWVAARPLTCADAGIDGGEAPWRCTLAQATAWCAARSRPGASWSIPDDTVWERAVRGGDGRRFPWGAGLDPGWTTLPSPCGAVGWGQGREWALRDGRPALRGGEGPTPCASWSRGDDGTALVRPQLGA